jgi:hypothetical protein
MQHELDLASILAQRNEIPIASELLERPVGKHHVDPGRTLVLVVRREMLVYPFEADVDPRIHAMFVLAGDLDAAAPWQEVGVVVDIGHEVEHPFGGVPDEDGFLNFCHKNSKSRPGDGFWESRPVRALVKL